MNDGNYIPDRPIAFNRDFARLGIGVTGALMLSQAVYWSKRTSNADGWFYKTQADWEEETALSRYEQETARKRLKALGILEEKRQGIPCRCFYRVNTEKLISALQTSMRESSKLDCGNPADKTDGIQQSNTENTQRLQAETTESTHANAPDLTPANPPAQQPAEQGPAQPDQPQPMRNDWEPVIDQLTASLSMAMIPEPVAHALANDQELIGQFKIHHSVSYGREHTRTGWTAQLAKWLARDWQKMGRPQTAPEYAAQRGLDPTISGCPTQELHALWSAKLGDIKPVPTLSEWQRSKSASNLAQRWHEGFTTPLNSDPNQMRYHDQETGLSWWGGLFDAIRNSTTLSKDNWINLQRLGSLDTLAQVVGQVLLEAKGVRS
ncbi:DnaT-like ssDNA-binding domain-containing protein [Marinospirillum sp. MEB164]|uniref:DnaT-like ssDNA-binding domain-containing protein n=1 Tax=Marinospirillum alkalitolerans TaxID=3123374 RepID=A0ABW8PW91_9GAMM